MAEDIAPGLLDNIWKAFNQNLKTAGVDKKAFMEMARNGRLKSITKYSSKVGDALSQAYMEVLLPEVMPDGILYYNIAEKTITPTMEGAHGMVSDVADELQKARNAEMKIGLKPIRPPIEMDRLKGIIDAVTSGKLTDTFHYLNEPVKNLVDHFGDYHEEKNVEFLDNSGVRVQVVRIANSKCCEWCDQRAGTYEGYSEAKKNDAFARHEGCRCQLEISNGSSKGRMRTSGHAFVRS